MSDMENKLARPLIPQRADPFVYRHDNGMYYFTASVPAFDLIILRCASTLEGLKDAEEKIVWRMHESGPMSLNIWAPEIHYVCGKWYIYFAAGEKKDVWKIRPWVLCCCRAGSHSWVLCRLWAGGVYRPDAGTLFGH